MDIAEKIVRAKTDYNEVYEAGQNKGYNDGYDIGFSVGYRDGEKIGGAEGFVEGYNKGYLRGKQEGIAAEYSRMWDRLQISGNLTNYADVTGFFNGYQFGFNNFYPKYDIRPVGNASRLFYAWENSSKYGITDNTGSLKQRLEECGVVLDTSKVTDATSMFNYCAITEIPTLDFTSLTDTTTHVFANSYSRMVTIEKIITKESVTYKNWFLNTDITNVTFEGVIGQDLDMSYGSRLTVESMNNIISCLKDYSGTDTTHTLSLGSTKLAKLTDAEKAVATQKGWTLA